MLSTHFEPGMDHQFCIDLEADWLIILDEVSSKSHVVCILRMAMYPQGVACAFA